MPENQSIEFKSSWRDEWLQWICGFANANGGKLYVGKENSGNVIGIENYERLMEELPNKVRDLLGISTEVNLLEENRLKYIEIITQTQSVAISYRGKYYQRVGATNLELTGNRLNEFLLKKSGRTWDDVIEERATEKDIDEESIKKFIIVAEKTNRLPEVAGLTNFEILEKLRLTEGEKYKRAAIILFGKDPGKFYPNISVKIGKFGKTADELLFEAAEEGNFFKILQNVLQQLNRKFFKNPIDFEGMQRVEKGEYPVAAIREMFLNALVHKSYPGAAIQIRIYDDKINIWNEGTLPSELTIDSLTKQHPSIPRNPIIADVCYKGGFIDTWGRGTLKIINSCKEAELPSPDIKEEFGGFTVTIFKDVLTEEQLIKLGINERQIKAVLYLKEHKNITNRKYQELYKVSKATATRDLTELVDTFKLLKKEGTTGAGTNYILMGS
ncbi:MAG TPA: ATP-binding protein [Ignavibacteriaceae bacterium]|nr:ATP-binding protein [Ignavibacteriaceae bacterium]